MFCWFEQVLVIDHADVISMQNWSHVNSVVEQLNRIPSKQHGTDIMRIRQWGEASWIIMERSKGFSNWIRFGEFGLRCLLGGVEACCREDKFGKVIKTWEEEGRKFRLELRANGAGRFILCSVRDLEAKRFSLVFPEGRGLIGGWVLIAEKLRSLGIHLLDENKAGVGLVGAKEGRRVEEKKKGEENTRSFVEVAKAKAGRIGDAVWIQLGGRALKGRDEQLGRCLVGRWETEDKQCPNLDCLKLWGRSLWNLKGGVRFSYLGGTYFLAEFELAEEAERVLRRGNRRVQDKHFQLERWGLEAGCFRHGVHKNLCWVRAVGLPLNFWNQEVFRKLGDSCGGLVAVDEDTTNFSQLQWARERLQGRDEGCLASHVGSSVGPSRVQGTMAAGEVDSEEQVGADTVEYGRGMAGGTEAGEDVDGKGKGAAEEVGFTSEGVGLRGKGSGPKEYWAESSKGGSLKKGGAQRDCGQIVGREKALAQEGFGVGLSKKGCDPSLGCSKEGGLRGLGQGVAQMGQDDGFMKARAPAFQSSCEELRLIEAIAGAALWTEGGGKTGADEALLEEVSRYSLPENCSLLSFGDRGLLSSSSSFCGEKNEDVMAVRDLVALEGPYVVNEEGRADPLRIIEVDGREREISFDMEKNIKGREGLIKMDVMKLRVLSWNVRGANDSEKRKVIKALIKSQKVDVVCLQETKIQEMSRMIVRSLGVGRCLDWKVLNSRGASGGVLVFWDKRVLQLLEAEVGNFSVSCRFKNWDFNVVRFPVESSRGGRLSASMRRFSEIMEDLMLRDLPLQGGSFTWKGGLNNQSHSRLDRFLISNEWEDHFSGSVQYVLPKPTSDHFPILLDGGGVRSGPMPFRLRICAEGRGVQRKNAGVLEFGKVEVNKALALSQVDFWDKMELSRTLSVQEVDAKRGAKEDFKKWALMEEISWRQKSREVWLSEGDRNNKFFHKMANAHRRGTCWRPSLRGLSFERLEAVDAASLEEPFSEQEVMEALKGFCGDKAPGPDGFSMAFWQSSWEFVKEEEGRRFKGFRPISLVGGLYKWLAKVLANRLKRVVGKVVSKAQNAFVQGRQILDAVWWLMSHEEDGVGEKWIRWMKWCISTVSFSVLVNGSSSAFSSLLRKAVAGGFVSACKARSRGGEGVNVTSHLLFADDTLVFCGASKVQLLHLNWILMWFEAMSGLRINLDKSAQYRSRAVWDGVEERMRKKLARWKSQYISKGGRITLIRSTLANMPIYFMSMLSMPRKVRLRLERIQREFLWGGGALERKIHLVKWELVCLEKDNGGLGVKSLSILNKALLCKWSWRFAMEREAFWNQVIRGKYGEEQGGWSSKEARGETHGVDIWCGDEPLCVSFPSLFALAVSKDAWVKDVWRCNEGGGSWSPLFSRPFNDWELEEVCSFFVALNRKQIQQGVDDRVIWRETKCGMFSVKSLYKSLVSRHPISFPSSAIWKVTVQPKVSFFGWVATWGKALTLDQLQRRGWALANRCYLVKNMKNQLITFFFIVKRLELFGCCSTQCSGCSGCCLPRLRRRFRGGMGLLWGRRGRVFGKQVLCAFFGRFGRQGTKLL
ncbi:putative ribonuclease H protein [Vitis vinifera]|uniref:Putative ribonuclease H protein n=1 Tax=Vitis vinifera TaxID=29760 RepID=A0A438JFR3_VITVI|nr:putative ribonuclease H protein [Vitis vinifera]